jgi:hypothetical protein
MSQAATLQRCAADLYQQIERRCVRAKEEMSIGPNHSAKRVERPEEKVELRISVVSLDINLCRPFSSGRLNFGRSLVRLGHCDTLIAHGSGTNLSGLALAFGSSLRDYCFTL